MAVSRSRFRGGRYWDRFASDDDVTNLKAVKTRLAEMIARPDLLERDLAALNKDYRKVIVELQDAQLRAKSAMLGMGRRNGLKAVRSFTDAIGDVDEPGKRDFRDF